MNNNARPRRRRWYSPIGFWRSLQLRPKVVVAIVAAVSTYLVLPQSLPGAVRATAAWNAGGLTYLALALLLMRRCDSTKIRSRAARQDDSAFVILCIILVAIAASFVSIGCLLRDARAAESLDRWAYLGLASLTIVVSWFVTQVVFTLHYAHEYYAPPERQHDARQGLVFPDDDNPDYWDFLYFAITVGATSQTSDTAIRSKSMRRLVTLHAVASFIFNTMVLALTVNLAASLV